MNKHTLLMLIGCVLPLLLIFLLPLFGINGNVSLLIFMVLMFGCHLLMPMGHGRHEDDDRAATMNSAKEV